MCAGRENSREAAPTVDLIHPRATEIAIARRLSLSLSSVVIPKKSLCCARELACDFSYSAWKRTRGYLSVRWWGEIRGWDLARFERTEKCATIEGFEFRALLGSSREARESKWEKSILDCGESTERACARFMAGIVWNWNEEFYYDDHFFVDTYYDFYCLFSFSIWYR